MTSFALKLATLFLISIIPALTYILISRKLKRRWRERLRRASEATEIYRAGHRLRHNYYNRYHQTTEYFIGDVSCQNNANSPYLRCAIAPDGPCEGCPHYESKRSQYNHDQNF